jgi:hypothetical protein
MTGYAENAAYLEVQEQDVRDSFARYGFPTTNGDIEIVKGLFKDTVPSFNTKYPNEKLAVLRIDSNFYDSYQDVFYYLYETVPVGGYIIFDDINSHGPVAMSWAHFQLDQGFNETLTPLDVHSS